MSYVCYACKKPVKSTPYGWGHCVPVIRGHHIRPVAVEESK